MSVLLETSVGDLVVDLDVEGSPLLVKNFLRLCQARYYTKTLLHTVAVPYTHLRAHETVLALVCRLLLENNTTHLLPSLDFRALIVYCERRITHSHSSHSY